MEDLLSYFQEVTGVDNERARFHLDAANWDLQVALAYFYECVEPSSDQDESIAVSTASAPTESPSLATTRRKKKNDKDDDDDEDDDDDNENNDGNDKKEVAGASDEATPIKNEDKARTTIAKGRRDESKARSNVRFGTISQLQSRESSSDSEEGQAFYAGGSKHSGQQVLGPSKSKNRMDMINDMIKSCQGQAIAVSEDRPADQHRNRPNTFGGTGYKLGQTNSDTEVVTGGDSTSRSDISEGAGSALSASLRSSNSGVIMLKLWRDGFTINDREIRPYSEPENREFLAAIKRGEIPTEIREEVQGAEVRLDMEDHRHEEYVPPKPKVKAFTGRGHKLGSPSPATVGMTVPSDPADQAANESQARSMLNLDASRPVTNIQIRLADGNNIRQQFNTSHTIGDVRRFITTMRPQYSLQEFSLLTTYPSRELNQEDETIEHAGLENSTVMQRIK